MPDAIRLLPRRWARLGLEGRPPRVARRLAVINTIAGFSILFSLAFLAVYALHDPAGHWPLMLGIVAQIVCLAFTPLWHRLGDAAAGWYFCVIWFCAITAFSYADGREAGTHFLFLPGAVAGLLLFGRERPVSATLCAAAALGLFFLAEFAFRAPAFPAEGWETFARINFVACAIIAYLMIALSTLYSFDLSRRAEDALEAEHARSERLLANLVPESVAKRLKRHPDRIIADELGQVTILFADIVAFTPRAEGRAASEVVGFLNRVFTEFDRLAVRHGLEKIKTIGDAYMVAAGMPDPRADHAEAVAEMALDMLAAARRLGDGTGEAVHVRIGFHAGPAVAGVIGTRKFFYDVWGDTVNTAARLESQGAADRIQVTRATRDLLADRYVFERRGEIALKGKGLAETWWLAGRRPEAAPARAAPPA